MELVVLDASVAAKWVLTEPDTAIALELLNGPIRCMAPAIIRVEVAGAVIRRLRTKAMSKDEARAACDDWEVMLSDAYVHLIPLEELYEASVGIALAIRHPLPDCLYLAAAQMLDCRLLTADQTLRERGLAVHPRIDLLARAA